MPIETKFGKSAELLVNVIEKKVKPYGAASEFCRKTGISRTALEKWLKRQSIPTLNTLDKIAEAEALEPWQLIKPDGAEEISKDKYARDIDYYKNQIAELKAKTTYLEARIRNVESDIGPFARELIELTPTLDDRQMGLLLLAAKGLSTGSLEVTPPPKQTSQPVKKKRSR